MTTPNRIKVGRSTLTFDFDEHRFARIEGLMLIFDSTSYTKEYWTSFEQHISIKKWLMCEITEIIFDTDGLGQQEMDREQQEYESKFDTQVKNLTDLRAHVSRNFENAIPPFNEWNLENIFKKLMSILSLGGWSIASAVYNELECNKGDDASTRIEVGIERRTYI